MTNPFSPAPGALPARILGRGPELSAIREAIRRAALGSPPVPLVFVGQRGMGKTVLLRELREIATRPSLTVPLEAIANRPLSEALREKLEALVESVEGLPAKASHTLGKTLKSLPKLSYELPHGGGAIAISPTLERDDSAPGSFAKMLFALATAARAAKRFVTITVDELQDADIRSLETLVRFVHESAQTDAPVLLGCAGLSETHAVLEKLRTYVQRWNIFELRLLTEAETIEAIREPIVAARVRIDEDALQMLAREAGGYPFFIQTFASAAWEAHRGSALTLADVQATLPEVRRRNELSFYVRPLARMSPRETLFALTLADLGPGAHDIGTVARALGVSAPDVSSIRATLVKKAIVAVPIPGKIEFRIPFTDRYLTDHRAEYETPEVDAYRSDLARRALRKAP